MTRLLVSVRSVDEARAALAGGADIIDVKEPTRGPLGRADDDVIRGVIDEIAGRVPVSAALGELNEQQTPIPEGLAFTKVGLATQGANWRTQWVAWRDQHPHAVLVAYADVHNIDEFVAFANETKPAALLIDTASKDGRTLLDFVTIEELSDIRRRCRIPLAVAGSLGEHEIDLILPLRPDIIAVRGAACMGGRLGNVDAGLVRALANRLARQPNGD